MSKFTNYFKESWIELTQKTTWPSWSSLQNSAIVVMVASVILAVVIWAMDFLFENIMKFIYTL